MTEIIRAEPGDAAVLGAVIAEAFFDLPPSRWLIVDETSRSKIFPAYFGIFVEHALADGIVHTTPDREAAALWIPVGDGPPRPPDGYLERLRAVTMPWTARFTEFDAALDSRHLAGPRITTCWPSGRNGKAAASARRCSMPAIAAWTTMALPRTRRLPASATVGCTGGTVTPTTARRFACPTARLCSPCSGSRLRHGRALRWGPVTAIRPDGDFRVPRCGRERGYPDMVVRRLGPPCSGSGGITMTAAGIA